MTHPATQALNMSVFDDEMAALVQLAAAVAGGEEATMREYVLRASVAVRPEWVEEVILQSYLFAGFPRALNAAREWRKTSGRAAPAHDEGEDYASASVWAERGEHTCGVVYGRFYERLRRNIRSLHPALDAWMIVDGYGKVLSRPQLDLRRRELCVVAACAAARQDRQLHSHLHGALHAGSHAEELRRTLDALAPLIARDDLDRYHSLLSRVSGSNVH
ncbi:MAG: carboxymuconolactone decarboxylase family protein [Gemmatimonadaceae bacterium]